MGEFTYKGGDTWRSAVRHGEEREMATKVQHTDDCDGWFVHGMPHHFCGGTWTCNRCEREFGYCEGSADEMPGLCDECWVVVDEAPDATEAA